MMTVSTDLRFIFKTSMVRLNAFDCSQNVNSVRFGICRLPLNTTQ